MPNQSAAQAKGFVSIPSIGFPSKAMFGSPALTPQIQQGRAASKPAVSAVSRTHVLVIAGAVIVVGYILFHLNAL